MAETNETAVAAEAVPVFLPGRQGEARTFCRTMITADENVLYGEVRRAGERAGLSITPQLFDEVHREVHGETSISHRESGASPMMLPGFSEAEAALTDSDTAEPMVDERPSPGFPPDGTVEARDLCRDLILAERTVRYRDVKRAAEGLGLAISKALFASVHRELAGRVRGGAGSAAASMRAPVERGLADLREGTSSLDFAVEYLTAKPQATYAEVRADGEAAGHRIVPITYGRARTLAGLPTTARGPSLAMEFLVPFMREHPDATYQVAKAAAADAGHDIVPVNYGLARKLAGLAARNPESGPRGRPMIPAMTFMVEYLGAHRDATFHEVKAAAAEAGHAIFPITYGNARRLAGIEKQAKPIAVPRSVPAPVRDGDRDDDATRSRVKSPAIAFMVEYLTRKPDAGYQEVKDAAAASGIKVVPITFGNARRVAGLEKLPPRAARPRHAEDVPTRRPLAIVARERTSDAESPGARPQRDRSAALSVLDELGVMVERLERQRVQLREALDGIAEAARECIEGLDA